MTSELHNITAPKSLFDVIADLWRARLWLFLGAALGVIAASLFVFSAVPHFRSQSIISPADTMSSEKPSLSSMGGDVAAVRLFVQRMGGSLNSFEFTRFEHIYDGPRVAGLLLQDPKILAGLKLDKNFSFMKPPVIESAAALSEYIARRVRLETVGQSSLRRLVYLHPNAAFGRYFLYELHKAADGVIRRSVLDQAAQRISHLNQEISRTNNPEHRRILTDLLMEQERLKMLASADSAYAAEVIEPPASSAKAVWPSVPLVYFAFIFVGALFGFVSYGVRYALKTGQVPGALLAQRWFRQENSNANTRRPLTRADHSDERDRA